MPFEINGIEAEIDKLNQLGASVESRCKKAVKAGVDYIVPRLKEAVPYDEGHVHDSIKGGPFKQDAANGFYQEVKPTGNDPKTGESLAKIGNILEHGRSNMPAQPWFESTLIREEGATISAMEAVFNEGLEG
ncbi:hypothetical protein LJC74_01030 [Eubacteriales bacterium OttesenSCG-928-A19]|nr:hypothetical protein [Eubacteriales bacterium OttesenSCG-928-A19]